MPDLIWHLESTLNNLDSGQALAENCSCVALISYIHVTMRFLHFRRPWRSRSK